ncbi:MAG: flagellin [Methylococcales bacterium]|nr:flagellin [Methylococcales bacterium]MDD5755110.1 flagellin [Methylococcales bacterium]
MTTTINTNLASINAQHNLQNSATALSTAMQRLSSGTRINSAKDDAAGLAIADHITSQIRGMTVATRNAYDGISLTQTAEGALSSLTDTLQRMRDLAVQSASNAGVSASDRAKMQTEFKALNEELLRVVQNSEFNGKKILNGDLANGLEVQVGANADATSRIKVAVSDMNTLLNPVAKSTLYPKGEAVDATLALAIASAATTAVANPQLKAANDATTLANAAVIAAKLAAASPTDLALANDAVAKNKTAASAINGAITGLTPEITSTQAFQDAVAVAKTNAAAVDTALTGAALTTTDANQAASLVTTAKQLAEAAVQNVSYHGQNLYTSTMASLDVNLDNAVANNVTKSALGADRIAQKTLAALDISRAIASASYINDPTKTQTANDTDKASFINNNKLVVETSMAADKVSADYALSSVNAIDSVIAAIDTERSNLGSTQNRFTTTIANLQNGIENQSAARSRITDADFAQETANLSRAQILQQAGIAILAQANQSGQSVLTLLR